MNLTGITNVGEFYSHHYLDALLENDLRGLFAAWKEEDSATPDRRLERCAGPFFTAKRDALRLRTPGERYHPSHRFHVELLEALGYRYQQELRYLLDGSALPLLGSVDRDGHPFLWLAETPFTPGEESPLEQGVVGMRGSGDARMRGSAGAGMREDAGVAGIGEGSRIGSGGSDAGWNLDEIHASAHPRFPASSWEDLIGEVFRVQKPPRWLMLLAGRYLYLVDRTKWGQGKYLLFDLDEILGRRQRETLRAAAALLSREALCPGDGLPIHETLDENSHKHAYAVSSDLKDGVRRAVELLANEYVAYQREVAKQALFQDDDLARRLRDEALTYLYRLLFLFYAEARGDELGLVPMKSESYRTGYSLESLRDLEQTPLNSPRAQNGYFFHESLDRLFALVDQGFQPQLQQELLAETPAAAAGEIYDYGFRMTGLRSPLFNRSATPLLSSVKFRNVVLQEVVALLSLSKEGRGRNSSRGRISYAQLGINQLGAVYEGLLSYTGFFAQEPLYEVKPAGADPSREDVQTYFVPYADLERYEADEFVYETGPDGSRRRKRYERGSFIFRLAGRDREKSASYYTPEVLTQCVVKYSLRELLKDKRADEILRLVFCEPAQGSGAFTNETINQLADAYLERKQQELGRAIAPDAYRVERQKVKAYLAAHNAYGVDLNPTAVELARVSFWLNTLYPDAPAPWYSARLAVGNSLIGARRQIYSGAQVKDGSYAASAPAAAPLPAPRPAGSIYHFLLPDKGMAAFDGDKTIRELAPDAVAAIKSWRKGFTARFSADEIRLLARLSDRIDALWSQHLRDRQTLLARTRDPISLWGQEREGEKGRSLKPNPHSPLPTPQTRPIAEKEAELARLYAPTSAYRRLKLAMDYWCSLWFWPIEEAGRLPTRAQYLADLDTLLAADQGDADALLEQGALYELTTDDGQPATDAAFHPSPFTLQTSSVNVDTLLATHPRLALAGRIAARQRFHHWELAFPEVFAERGGFDLIVGNPPWVKLSFDETGVLSEYDPLLALRKMRASDVAKERPHLLTTPERTGDYLREFGEIEGTLSFLNAAQNYPLLVGMQTNLYKCFITQAWGIGSRNGIAGFLHPEGIYDDPRGGELRQEIYSRLTAHFQFHNELKLFAEIGNVNRYSINVLRIQRSDDVLFANICNLYHPSTVDRCYSHDGAGNVPGIRDDDDDWNLTGHARRIVWVNKSRLALFSALFDNEDTPSLQARLPSIHSEQLVEVLDRFAQQPRKLANLNDKFIPIELWHERNDQDDGTIRHETRFPLQISEWILSGPHFFVATPFNKTPNEGCSSHRDYSDIDLLAISENYLPRTNYVPACEPTEYLSRIPKWRGKPITEDYRHVHRRMLNQTGERTLINAIVPPWAGNVDTIFSLNFENRLLLVQFSGLCSSVVFDFFVRSTGKNDLRGDLIAQLPYPEMVQNSIELTARTLRLNCLTVHYADLWQELYDPAFNVDGWAKADRRLRPWSALTAHWQREVALRTPFERRQALVEIDVLAALALGLTLDELITIYRVQFPVLQKYERRKRFDARGMEVPMKSVRGELVVDESKPELADMIAPFTPVDREADYEEAWGWFGKRLGD
jgi:hypothetical protein